MKRFILDYVIPGLVAAVVFAGAILVLSIFAGCAECPEDTMESADAAPTPPIFCGKIGDGCCVGDVDGRAVLLCHEGVCAFPHDVILTPDFRGICSNE